MPPTFPAHLIDADDPLSLAAAVVDAVRVYVPTDDDNDIRSEVIERAGLPPHLWTPPLSAEGLLRLHRAGCDYIDADSIEHHAETFVTGDPTDLGEEADAVAQVLTPSAEALRAYYDARPGLDPGDELESQGGCPEELDDDEDDADAVRERNLEALAEHLRDNAEPLHGYLWPCSLPDEDDEALAVLTLETACYAVRLHDGTEGLVLGAAGMDCSDDIALAYIAAGHIPPAHIRLPRMAGEDPIRSRRTAEAWYGLLISQHIAATRAACGAGDLSDYLRRSIEAAAKREEAAT